MRTKMTFVLLVVVFNLIFIPSVFAADNFQKGDSVNLGKDEIINDDYYAWGENITISGTVNGDVYTAGSNVNIDGEVYGDVIVAGGNVFISGKINQDIRVAGGQVTISGEVGRNITALGGSVNINNSAKISGSVTAASGNLMVFAPIGKSLTLAVGEATIGNSINGNVNAVVGKLILNSSSNINGDLTYLSEENADLQPGSKISGKTIHNLPVQNKQKPKEKSLGAVFSVFKLFNLISYLIIGFLILKLVPNYTKKVINQISQKPTQSLFIGFLTVVAGPLLMILIAITLIGIPIALITFFAYCLTLYLSKIFFSVALGEKILSSLKQKPNEKFSLFIGLIIIMLISLIPIIGKIFMIILVFAGSGAIVVTKFTTYKEIRSKKLI